MEIIIRVYHPTDLARIVWLWYKTWHSSFPNIKHPHPYHLWEDRFRDYILDRGEIWVAEVKTQEVETQIVGFIVVFKGQYKYQLINWCIDSGTTGELNQIFVDPTYQNKGIGTVLLDKAKEICPQGLRLTTLQSNTKACLFYAKHGFTPGNMSINKINGQPNIEYIWFPVKIDG